MDTKTLSLFKEVFSNIDYEKIILFGSRARGDFSEGSDHDVLIIVRKTLPIKEKMRLFTLMRKDLAKRGIDADIIIKSRDEINYLKNKIGNVVRHAMKEGVTLC